MTTITTQEVEEITCEQFLTKMSNIKLGLIRYFRILQKGTEKGNRKDIFN